MQTTELRRFFSCFLGHEMLLRSSIIGRTTDRFFNNFSCVLFEILVFICGSKLASLKAILLHRLLEQNVLNLSYHEGTLICHVVNET